MRQLRYAGPGEDAAHVIVEVLDGSDRFTLVLDDPLRAAAKQELPRLPRDEATTSLSPRDIQTRVRGGASAEAIAEESGLEVDRVMRFAYPVLQERARVADEARRARARRTSPQGEMAVFGEIVDGRLGAHGIEPTDVTWDSFRRPDGVWTITAGWRETDTERFAQWSFALSTRVISPLDDTAGDLLSDRALRPVGVDEPEAEDVATVGGAFDAAGLADPTNPTGPIPQGLRVAAAVRIDDDPVFEVNAQDGDPSPFADGRGDRHPSSYPARPDPAPRGLDSFFGPRIVPDPGADVADVDLRDGFEAAFDPDEPPLPLVMAEAPPGRRFRGTHRVNGAGSPEEDSPDSKAARARIPSWDDILLGVRRRGD